jgi:pilus assembly protein CpaE
MNRKTKQLLIIDEDILAITELKQKLADSQQVKICGEASRVEDIWQVIQAANPDVILLGSLQDMELGVLCQQIRFYFPQIAFIAACSARELHWEPFLRNLGIWVIGKPVQPAQLEMLALQLGAMSFGPMAGFPPSAHSPLRVSDHRTEPPYMAPKPEHKQMITVYGPKGGVGKTFLSRELAVYFALQKKDGRPLKVLAVDFNIDLGTIATSLNLSRTPNLFTWVQAIDQQLAEMAESEGRNPDTVSHAEWQEYASAMRCSPQEVERYVVVHQQTNLHVLTSPREIRHSFDIKDYHLYIILETLKQSDYDVILIDTAPDTTDATIQALFFARQVVMVGNPVVDAIENIQRMLKLLREAEYPEERIQICINRLQRKEMFTLEEMRAYFQLHPGRKMYTIPDDQEVKKSINSGMPVMLQTGRSAAKEALETLAKSLLPLETDQPKETGKPKTKQRPAFLSWLRR